MDQLVGFLLHPPLSEIAKKLGKMLQYTPTFKVLSAPLYTSIGIMIFVEILVSIKKRLGYKTMMYIITLPLLPVLHPYQTSFRLFALYYICTARIGY